MGKHGKHRSLVGRFASLILAGVVWASPVAGQCRLALALAMDVSSSVDAAEDRLQRQGLANALISDDIRQEILTDHNRPIALAVFEWSGRYQQELIVPWRILRSEADVFLTADAIRKSTRSHSDFPTAMGYAAGILAEAPPCLFKTLDVSGDGVNNEGFEPFLAYKNFPLTDVTVNGLAIGGTDDLATYYRRKVIKGLGAFVEEAEDFNDFERAMRRKLLREVSARNIGLGPLPGPKGG